MADGPGHGLPEQTLPRLSHLRLVEFGRRPQVYNVSIALGLAAASPAFVALGTILAIPGNVVVDAALGGARLTTLQGVGAVVVVSAFVLLAREPPRRDDVALDSASSNPLFEGGAVA